MEHLADGPVVARLHGLVVRLDGGEDLPSLDIVSLAETTLPVGDVATPGAKGVEDLGKLAIGEKTIQATRAQLEDGLVSLGALEPVLIGILWNKASVL